MSKQNPMEPQPTLKYLVANLAKKVLISIGKQPNPITNQLECNLIKAEINLNLINVIRNRTYGNLTPDEELYINDTYVTLSELYRSI